jgi:hypothetical protein
MLPQWRLYDGITYVFKASPRRRQSVEALDSSRRRSRLARRPRRHQSVEAMDSPRRRSRLARRPCGIRFNPFGVTLASVVVRWTPRRGRRTTYRREDPHDGDGPREPHSGGGRSLREEACGADLGGRRRRI